MGYAIPSISKLKGGKAMTSAYHHNFRVVHPLNADITKTHMNCEIYESRNRSSTASHMFTICMYSSKLMLIFAFVSFAALDIMLSSHLRSLYSPTNIPRLLGVTQGKKGQKAKRINMAFSDENYEYITFESRHRGLSATAFVNAVIAQYKDSADGHID